MSTSPRTQPHRPRSHRHAIVMLGVIIVLLAALAPLAAIHAVDAAQTRSSQEQRPCDPGFVRDETTGECEALTLLANPTTIPTRAIDDVAPNPTAVPTEEIDDLQAQPTETPDAGEPPQEPLDEAAATETPIEPTGFAQHIARVCPNGFTADGATITDFQNGCTEPVADMAFAALSGNVQVASSLTDASGLAQLGELPAEVLTFTATLPVAGDPAVYCAAGYAFAPFEHTWEETDRQVGTGATIGWPLAPDTLVQCFWYLLPLPVDDIDTEGIATPPSRVVVNAYICPAGLEPESEDFIDWQTTCTVPGTGLDVTLDNAEGSSTAAIGSQFNIDSYHWDGVPLGPFTLTLTPPVDHASSMWWCGLNVWADGVLVYGSVQPVDAPGDAYAGAIDGPDGGIAFCWVFSVPEIEPDRTVSAHKYVCSPDVLPASETFTGFDDWADACAVPAPDVDFSLTYAGGDSTQSTDITGTTTWHDTPQGDIGLTEHTPPGFHDPVVYCSLDASFEDGAVYSEALTLQEVDGSSVSRQHDYAGYAWDCHFFNIEKGPGHVTVDKWTCPPGYDVEAWGADPTVDCTEHTDGIPFLFGPQLGLAVEQTTGEILPGAVTFPNLAPGAYVLTEQVPEGTDHVFVWECVGGEIPAVQTHPVVWGAELVIDVAAGDDIHCDVYNVPHHDRGSVTVHKYSCWTEVFVSPIDCETYEFGASFELFDPADAALGIGVTGAGGTWAWHDLVPGTYRLTEIDGTPCHVVSSEPGGMQSIPVVAGVETIIEVYNCNIETGGKVPEKYPNTGMAPAANTAPARAQATPATTAVDADARDAYRISCLDPVSDGTPVTTETCRRGPVPTHIRIEAAGVDHPIEVLEIVDGVMQAPTGPDLASWYRETGRPGEPSNQVIAGHLNWWNVPEGPFYHLDTLAAGDRIEITGDDGATYVYAVEWVRQESNLEPPDPEVVGPTDTPSLTLITCGGEWDASIAEYDARTVVRAIQTVVIPASADAD